MPAITKPNQHFDATLYTGTSAAQTITNAGAFQPDLVWMKARNNANYHWLTNSVTGTGEYLSSNDTIAARTGVTDALTSFNSNGFSLGVNTSDAYLAAGVNYTGRTYVGWQWKGGGTAVTNTSGATQSQVSANTTSGFSVVTYTSPNTLVDTTIGHGLGAIPQFIIVKNRDASFNWDIWHKDLSSGYGLVFATDAQTAGRWSTTTPTSTVFTAKYNYEHVSTNKFVAYCWTPIAGFSQFGSYTGNGSTDGPFIYTGFRPRFIMFKRTDSTGDWTMVDTSRNTYNVMTYRLYANLNNAEDTDTPCDSLSNGFKIRTTAATVNASSGTFIYAAFAENPFKYANAR